jgi:hypothetical protein
MRDSPFKVGSQNRSYSILLSCTQTRQSTRLFLQSSQFGPPTPLTAAEVTGDGVTHSLAGERGGVVPTPTKGQTQWYSRYICTLRSLALSYRFDVVPKERA